MTINGKEIGFSLTLGALKELSHICPEGNIDNIDRLFSGDTTSVLENMAKFVTILNKWFCYKKDRSFEDALIEDDVFALEVPEIRELFALAMKAFKGDNTPTTEVTPTKK